METDERKGLTKRLAEEWVVTKMIGAVLLVAAWAIPAPPESPWYVVKTLIAAAGLIVLFVEPYSDAVRSLDDSPEETA